MPGPTATSTFPEPSTTSRHGSTIIPDVDEEAQNNIRPPHSEPTTPRLTRSRLRGLLDSGQTSLTEEQMLSIDDSGHRAAEDLLIGVGEFVNGPQPSGSPERGITTQNETATETPPESDPCEEELQRLEDNRRHLAGRRRRHTNSRARRRGHPVSTWMSMKRIVRDPPE